MPPWPFVLVCWPLVVPVDPPLPEPPVLEPPSCFFVVSPLEPPDPLELPLPPLSPVVVPDPPEPPVESPEPVELPLEPFASVEEPPVVPPVEEESPSVEEPVPSVVEPSPVGASCLLGAIFSSVWEEVDGVLFCCSSTVVRPGVVPMPLPAVAALTRMA